MIPTTILLECGPCNEQGRPIDLQPTLTHPMAQRWRDVRAVFDETVGGVPIYVMSLTNGGRVIGAWDMLESMSPLTEGAVRMFQENPQAQFALAGPLAASEHVIVCGNHAFRQAATMAINDASDERHFQVTVFDSTGAESGPDGDASNFEWVIGHVTGEHPVDRKARLFRELDRVEAMYDGRIPIEMRQYRQRLRDALMTAVKEDDGS